jgi:predicted protein tyrosine phosphatase
LKAVTMPETLGRPRGTETRRRTTELLRLLAAGHTLHEAATEARVKPERVLRLFEDKQFRAAYVTLVEKVAA